MYNRTESLFKIFLKTDYLFEVVAHFHSSIVMRKEGNTIDHDIKIRQAAAGDQEAFRSLVEEYKNLVYVLCYNVVQDHYEAENLTQETFLQVYRSLSRYEFKGFKTWLSRIAINKAIDQKRAKSRQKLESIGLTEIDNIPDHSISVPDLILRQEEMAMLEECLRRIPHHYGTIIRKSLLG